MTKIIFIADFFASEIAGGGELNNEEVINCLRNKGYAVETKNSRDCTVDYLKNNQQCFFIVANFIELHSSCLRFLEKLKYVIYEHDHKYIRSRNPASYNDYKAPETELVNQSFYHKAKAVLCQSSFHKSILLKNLPNVNVISLSGNAWSDSSLDLMEQLVNSEKLDKCAIMNTTNWHKNTSGAISYCKQKNYDYTLIDGCEYQQFLRELSKNKKLVFFPQTPETLSRIVVECRMMGMSVITNDKVGASQEEWFKLKGKDLIDFMRVKKKDIILTIERLINE